LTQSLGDVSTLSGYSSGFQNYGQVKSQNTGDTTYQSSNQSYRQP
jgi:hypothetical protein